MNKVFTSYRRKRFHFLHKSPKYTPEVSELQMAKISIFGQLYPLRDMIQNMENDQLDEFYNSPKAVFEFFDLELPNYHIVPSIYPFFKNDHFSWPIWTLFPTLPVLETMTEKIVTKFRGGVKGGESII